MTELFLGFLGFSLGLSNGDLGNVSLEDECPSGLVASGFDCYVTSLKGLLTSLCATWPILSLVWFEYGMSLVGSCFEG